MQEGLCLLSKEGGHAHVGERAAWHVDVGYEEVVSVPERQKSRKD